MTKKKTDLLPVYLAVGDDRLMRDTVVDRIRARVAELGDLDFNSETLEGGSVTGVEIVDAANTFPFASEKRLVIVRDAEKLSKDDQAIVAEYLASPSETSVLMLLAEKLARNTKLFSAVLAVGPKAVIDTGQRSKRDLPATVVSMALGKGLVLSPSDASYLIERAGRSTVKLDSELDKIVAFVGDRNRIDRSDIDAVVVPARDVAPWELPDAVSARDLATLVELVGDLFDDGRSPIELLGSSIRRIRDLLSIKALRDRGEGPSAIAAALGQPEWKLRSLIQWAEAYESEELRAALIGAAQADADMKSGADPAATLELWLYSLVAGADGRRRAG